MRFVNLVFFIVELKFILGRLAFLFIFGCFFGKYYLDLVTINVAVNINYRKPKYHSGLTLYRGYNKRCSRRTIISEINIEIICRYLFPNKLYWVAIWIITFACVKSNQLSCYSP